MTTIWTKRFSSGVLTDNTDDKWTTATRPLLPASGYAGYNTDINGVEVWNGSAWQILSGSWTTATRPTTTLLAPGSTGFNTDAGMGQESWDGSEWTVE